MVREVQDFAQGDTELPDRGPHARYCTKCHNLALKEEHICEPEKSRPASDHDGGYSHSRPSTGQAWLWRLPF